MLYAETLRDQLLRAARALAEAQGTGITTVAQVHARDSGFFSRIANGGSFTAQIYDRVMSSISLAMPDGAWPDDIPRPTEGEANATLEAYHRHRVRTIAAE